ncbi:clotting factor G beta subunit-like [Tachypleus tridentatus]|uniref:clotting factor G beta subunit-like n=1 Tax=Tachypleus tridentatus TaxID=6853 RepID=UPI003FD4A2AB
MAIVLKEFIRWSCIFALTTTFPRYSGNPFLTRSRVHFPDSPCFLKQIVYGSPPPRICYWTRNKPTVCCPTSLLASADDISDIIKYSGNTRERKNKFPRRECGVRTPGLPASIFGNEFMPSRNGKPTLQSNFVTQFLADTSAESTPRLLESEVLNEKNKSSSNDFVKQSLHTTFIPLLDPRGKHVIMRNISQSHDTSSPLTKNERRFLIKKQETVKKTNGKTALIRPTFNVVGGIPALVGAWPWMAAIFYNGGKRFLCAGFLIDERHVLSAAHCFINKVSTREYVVKLGHSMVNKGSAHGVKAIRVHELYKPRQHYHDITLVQLKKRVEFTNTVLPVCLDNLEGGGLNRFNNVTTTLLGWGDLTFGGPTVQILHEATGIPLVPNSECNNSYSRLANSPFPHGITSDFLCAGLRNGGKDACQGDSGGPLMMEDKDGRWTAIGIVSFGHRCADPGYPGVYTRIARYLKWIEYTIDQLSIHI